MRCDVCGKDIERSSYMSGNICSQECFFTDYWNKRVKEMNSSVSDHRIAIIGRTMYHISPDNYDQFGYKGFRGREFKINFFDGRKIITRNLWDVGTIPDQFRDKLSPNAEFDWGAWGGQDEI